MADIDSPGSGWGGFSAGDTAQFGTPDAPAGSLGGFEGGMGGGGGKPGESNMAQAQAQQNLTPLSDRPDTRDQTGWYSGAPGQTVAQLERNQSLNDALSWGVPMAASALVPGWGLINTVQRTGAKLMNGAKVDELVADLVPGYINGKLNQATGGILGQATMAGNVLNSLTGSPQVPNIGREVVSGILGRPSGSTGAGTAQPATSTASEGNGDTSQTGQTVAQQASPAPQAQPQADVNYASLGIDSAGWTSAGRNYLEKRNGLV